MFWIIFSLLLPMHGLAEEPAPTPAIQQKVEAFQEASRSMIQEGQRIIVDARVALLGEGARRSIFARASEMAAEMWSHTKRLSKSGLRSLDHKVHVFLLDEPDSDLKH